MPDIAWINSLTGGSIVGVMAIIIFLFYRQDKKDQIDQTRKDSEASIKRVNEDREAEINRWQAQLDIYEDINRELVECRKVDAQSRVDLAENLGHLAESIRACGLRNLGKNHENQHESEG